MNLVGSIWFITKFSQFWVRFGFIKFQPDPKFRSLMCICKYGSPTLGPFPNSDEKNIGSYLPLSCSLLFTSASLLHFPTTSSQICSSIVLSPKDHTSPLKSRKDLCCHFSEKLSFLWFQTWDSSRSLFKDIFLILLWFLCIM